MVPLLLWASLVGLLYFLAAHLALQLQVEPQRIAVFWPAAGIASGFFVNANRDRRVAASLGIFIGAVVASVLEGRSLAVACGVSLCDVVQPWVFAVLLGRDGRASFGFDNLRAIVSFFTASAVSAGVAGALGALVVLKSGHSAADPTDVWGAWFAADTIGAVIVAPFVISLRSELAHPRPLDRTAAAHALAVALLIAVAAAMITNTPVGLPWAELWFVTTMFPLMLWLSTSTRPVFLTAGIMLVGILILLSTSLGVGHFEHPDLRPEQRVLPARFGLVSLAFCALLLIAMFTQRRQVEAALLANTERFEKLAAAAPGMIYSFRMDAEGNTSIPYASAAIERLLGFRPADVAHFAGAVFHRIHPQDRGRIEESIARSRQTLTPWHDEFRYTHPELGELWLEGHSMPVKDTDGVVVWHGFVQDITSRKRSQAHIEVLTGEVNHRANNMLAVVQAVAFNTAREIDPDQFLETFDKRLGSLAVSHSLLVGSQWKGVSLHDLVTLQLAHLGGMVGDRITLEGPPLQLNASASQVIGMALHELATNAIKHGALSTPAGMVDIAWTSGDSFRMCWTERGGPAVAVPIRQGFGQNVMVRMAEHQLDATAGIQYVPAGLVWRLEAESAMVLEPDSPRSGEPGGPEAHSCGSLSSRTSG